MLPIEIAYSLLCQDSQTLIFVRDLFLSERINDQLLHSKKVASS